MISILKFCKDYFILTLSINSLFLSKKLSKVKFGIATPSILEVILKAMICTNLFLTYLIIEKIDTNLVISKTHILKKIKYNIGNKSLNHVIITRKQTHKEIKEMRDLRFHNMI